MKNNWPTKKLKMNRSEVQDYCVKNQYATMRFFDASKDYVAARCCTFNGLVSVGFILACQAVEKILKAFIYLENGEQMKQGHNPYKLKEKLKTLRDYKIDRYDTLLKKLYDHYLARYYEDCRRHEDGTSGACSDELMEIDKLWLELVRRLPIPDEVRYRSKFITDLFENNPYWNNRYWITTKNRALKKQISAMQKRYKEVFQYLYEK